MEMQNLEFFVQIVMLSIILFFSIYFIKEHFKKKKKNGESHPYMIYLGICFLMVFIGDLFYLYLSIIEPIDIQYLWDTPDYLLLWKLRVLFKSIGFSFVILQLERNIFKGKDYLIFFLIYIIMVIIVLIGYPNIPMPLFFIIGVASSGFIPVGYFIIAFKSTGTVRKRAIVIGFSFMVFMFATLLQSPYTIEQIYFKNNLDVHLFLMISHLIRIAAITLIFLSYQ